MERELEEARYEASLAARRYEQVNPAKRHVARELEARWNTALERVQQIERRLVGLDAERASRPAINRAALMDLAQVIWRTMSLPCIDRPQTWVKPRKSNAVANAIQ